MNLSFGNGTGAAAAMAIILAAACQRPPDASDPPRVDSVTADSMGAAARDTVTVAVRSRRALGEKSSATLSASQPGVVFTINDSGNDPVLYAIDTTGADRGAWRVVGSMDVDWEATAIGRCGDDPRPRCVYIGDVGDNHSRYPARTIYRVKEPDAGDSTFTGDIRAERLDFRYADHPKDVEAMYVAPNGDILLINKAPMPTRAGALRPALVYAIPASAWSTHGRTVATVVDSISLVPGSAPLRTITDAALSPDARHLAVRTYSQVYIYATDPGTGRVNHALAPAICDIVSLGESQGEGITWANTEGRLIFTSEGRTAPMRIANCPLPR